MAIVKHIKSRNANYSAAINYLLFEHDEKTGKKIVDESGRSILRKEFYMDGLNCDPMSFDKECELTNAHFHKNKKREDIKSHHYIISYDPADVTENGLTGERAQAISLELAKQMFPGYQALGTRYGKEHLEQTFLRKDPLAILYVRSHLRLVVNLQTNVKAMQSPAYAHRVKLTNLQQMANTIIYVQEHGFDTQSDLKNTLLASKQELKEMQTQFAQHRSDLRILNDQIRYTGQYYANKEIYSQFSNAKYKGKYRKEHAKEIQKYEEARDWLRSFYQDGKMTSLKTLTLQKEKLQQQMASEEEN